jgi:hypothetical protein
MHGQEAVIGGTPGKPILGRETFVLSNESKIGAEEYSLFGQIPPGLRCADPPGDTDLETSLLLRATLQKVLVVVLLYISNAGEDKLSKKTSAAPATVGGRSGKCFAGARMDSLQAGSEMAAPQVQPPTRW